jgi:hypothetical protein
VVWRVLRLLLLVMRLRVWVLILHLMTGVLLLHVRVRVLVGVLMVPSCVIRRVRRDPAHGDDCSTMNRSPPVKDAIDPIERCRTSVDDKSDRRR